MYVYLGRVGLVDFETLCRNALWANFMRSRQDKKNEKQMIENLRMPSVCCLPPAFVIMATANGRPYPPPPRPDVFLEASKVFRSSPICTDFSRSLSKSI